jgi:hypothetical protein
MGVAVGRFSWATLTKRGKTQAAKSHIAATFESCKGTSAKIAVLEKKGQEKLGFCLTSEQSESYYYHLVDRCGIRKTSI